MGNIFPRLQGTSGLTKSGKAAKTAVGRTFDKDTTMTVLFDEEEKRNKTGKKKKMEAIKERRKERKKETKKEINKERNKLRKKGGRKDSN